MDKSASAKLGSVPGLARIAKIVSSIFVSKRDVDQLGLETCIARSKRKIVYDVAQALVNTGVSTHDRGGSVELVIQISVGDEVEIREEVEIRSKAMAIALAKSEMTKTQLQATNAGERIAELEHGICQAIAAFQTLKESCEHDQRCGDYGNYDLKDDSKYVLADDTIRELGQLINHQEGV